MKTRAAEQLFYDSEAALRLVDTLLDELEVMEVDVTRTEDQILALSAHEEFPCADPSELTDLLVQTHGEIRGLLKGLRQSRDVLERTSLEKLQGAADEQAEAPSVSELRDGLGRAIELVARLDPGESPGAPSARAELGEELHRLLAVVRAHEISEQQLSYASGVLHDTEASLTRLAGSIDLAALEPRPR